MPQKTHPAVVTVGSRQPLELRYLPTPSPKDNELLVRVEWTASTPLDLHQADGGLLVTHPQVLGDSCAGTVVSKGSLAEHLAVGDKVFGFTFNGQQEKAHQEFVVAPENLFGKIPEGIAMEDALELPWPKPMDFIPKDADLPILIWGGSSSVGQYAIQLLHFYGYRKIIAAASQKHHDFLKTFGAIELIDYREKDAIQKIRRSVGGPLWRILDCIGSLEGSMRPIIDLAENGTIVAVMLPVVVIDAGGDQAPEYSMDVTAGSPWQAGVQALGVRTHFYQQDPFLAKHLQTDIMPAMLRSGVVKPNRVMIVEGDTLLERAEKALDLLRRKIPSGERLVWRVAD